MGVGAHASGSDRPGVAALAQPAYGEYAEQPEVEAQHEYSEQKSTRHDWLMRVLQWPVILTMVLTEIAWLLLLGYAAHRFVLEPILG